MANTVSNDNDKQSAVASDLEVGLQKTDTSPARGLVAAPVPQQEKEQEQELVLHPIAQAFIQSEMGRTIFGLVLPLTAAFLSPLAPTDPVLRTLILSCICFGLAALWNGILLRKVLPRYANALEQIGAGLVLLGFYGLISALLPGYFKWIPWISFVVVLSPFYMELALG